MSNESSKPASSPKDSPRLKLNRETVAKLTVRTGLRAGGRGRGVIVAFEGSAGAPCTELPSP